MPRLARTTFDCTVTSQSPVLADWLALGAGDGEWWRGGYTRIEAAGGLMGKWRD